MASDRRCYPRRERLAMMTNACEETSKRGKLERDKESGEGIRSDTPLFDGDLYSLIDLRSESGNMQVG